MNHMFPMIITLLSLYRVEASICHIKVQSLAPVIVAEIVLPSRPVWILVRCAFATQLHSGISEADISCPTPNVSVITQRACRCVNIQASTRIGGPGLIYIDCSDRGICKLEICAANLRECRHYGRATPTLWKSAVKPRISKKV